MTVAFVWTNVNKGQGGSVYGPEWLRKLRAGVEGHVSFVPRFKVLWDFNLTHQWPGWWAKIELFTPGRFRGQVLFMDLDTLVTGDLADILAYRGEFAICRDFYHNHRMQSCVMSWCPGPHTHHIYERFTADPEHFMQRYRSDQEFIEDSLKETGLQADYWQDMLPGQVVSLKVHARDACPPDARLVCGHGEPRLSAPEAGWAHERWRQL